VDPLTVNITDLKVMTPPLTTSDRGSSSQAGGSMPDESGSLALAFPSTPNTVSSW
jgi:hypothetical protein